MLSLLRPLFIVTLVTLLLAAGGGCSEPRVSDRDLMAVNESRMAAAVEDPSTVIVDVRRPERYREGHIPTAINIFLPEIRARDPRLATAQAIIVYGGGWGEALSSAAAKKMISLGYTNVHDFRGGVELWRDAGYELVVPDEAEAAAGGE